jgi:hypothetical protein
VRVDPQIVRDWVAYQHSEPGTSENERLVAALLAVTDMVRKRPEEGWLFVLEALELDNSTSIQEVLSAGPLEDLLAEHGELLIERVEIEARRNPAFASLLGGVWQNSMTDEIWRRVQKVWDRRGWDGSPAA